MAINQGELVQIVDVQEYLGEEILNVYYYRFIPITPATGNYLELMAAAFIATVLDPVLDIQANLLEHTELRLRNLTNNLDFHVEVLNVFGNVATTTAQAAPSYLSYGFQLIRESLATRNGYKRYAGLNDATIDGNSTTISSTLTDAVCDGLSADLNIGIVPTLEPIIYRQASPPPVAVGYTYSSIGDAIFKGVGTQNTRKP